MKRKLTSTLMYANFRYRNRARLSFRFQLEAFSGPKKIQRGVNERSQNSEWPPEIVQGANSTFFNSETSCFSESNTINIYFKNIRFLFAIFFSSRKL